MPDKDDFYQSLLDNLYDGVYFVDQKRRISYWNRGAERITGYAAADVLGKGCADNLLMHIDQEGRNLCDGCCPLSESLSDGQQSSKEIYLLHKDGHRVPISVRVSPIRDEQGAIIGAVEVFTDNTTKAAMTERLAEIERIAYVDTLTSLANRRYTEIALASRFEEMQRYGWPYGVIFTDIDNFKHVNDRYGHDVGDEVLKMVAKTIVNSTRSFDVVGRWGGEEFLAIIANVSGEELIRTANRFRLLVEKSRLPGEHSIHVTVSLGAAIARPGETTQELIKRVDEYMYRSKAEGKNRVTADQ
jgi:diguanylate cyclase (GGDEF)-like protein/PAS domain S-box-containing protein